ncbi:MAG: hypothetical protein QXX17_05110 [Conexivisphaerales archaeon]
MSFSTQPSNIVEMDFLVLKEDYSRYLLSDGTILKAKIVVRKIFKSLDMTAQGYPFAVTFDGFNAVNVIVPKHLKHRPSTEPLDIKKDIGEEVEFQPQEEKWQEYITATEGLKVLIKPVVTKVIRYKKYDMYGDPIYTVNIQSITNLEKIPTTATS